MPFDPEKFIGGAVSSIRSQVGNGRAIIAVSGGVDSSVAAALCSRALGGRVRCVFVDTGLMRKGEAGLEHRVHCHGQEVFGGQVRREDGRC